jgi:hypothetical protein
MMGGDLPTSSPETIALLTNHAVLTVLREARGSREVLREGDLVLWAARTDDVDGPRFAAAFHLGAAPTSVRLRPCGCGSTQSTGARATRSRTCGPARPSRFVTATSSS